MREGDDASGFAALRTMLLIRAIETALARRKDHGFQLLSSGEEAVAVGIAAALADGDQLLTGGRSIGPALARGVDPARLVAELLGKRDGFNGGRAGRGHMAHPPSGFFGAHAVVAGNISIAAGHALAMQQSGVRSVVVILFGDGAAGAGVLHETLNIAALWRLPLIFVCNDNGLSVSTPREAGLAPQRLSDLGTAFGVPGQNVDGLDVGDVTKAVSGAVVRARDGAGPSFLECRSIRLRAHSTTARETRTRAEVERLQARCPIAREARRLGLDADMLAALENEANDRSAAAFAFADASPYPALDEVLDHVE